MTDTTNGWPDKPGVPLDTLEGYKMMVNSSIPHLPTQLTYDCRAAIGGNGPLAYTWQDKPHRLVYDLCREIERIAAGATPDQATALQARIAELEAALHRIEYLDRPQVRGLPRRNTIQEIARAALEGKKDER